MARRMRSELIPFSSGEHLRAVFGEIVNVTEADPAWHGVFLWCLVTDGATAVPWSFTWHSEGAELPLDAEFVTTFQYHHLFRRPVGGLSAGEV